MPKYRSEDQDQHVDPPDHEELTERQERALANIIRYNQLSREGGKIPSHLDPEREVKKQAFYLTHSNIKKNDKGLEVCEDCGEGEIGLNENICTNFINI